MTVDRGVPTDPVLERVERWLADSRATQPRPEPSRVLGPLMSDLGATSQRGSKHQLGSMLSATKFVVAGAIVALFGGFLLAGILTQPSGEVSAPAARTTGPGTFSLAGALGQGRVEHTATLLPDGRVLVIGGWGSEGSQASAEFWDPETGSFSPAGSLARPSQGGAGHTATLLADGRVLVVGGYGEDLVGLEQAEVWDPETAAFSPAGTLTEGHAEHTATLLPDGRVLIVGGYRKYQDLARTAEVWDPETASFAPVELLAPTRFLHTATLLPDRGVLIVGGGGGASGMAKPHAEVWDPVTASSSSAGSLAEVRMEHTATKLSNDRVLLVGGVTDQAGERPTMEAEVWDSVTASFGPAGSLLDGARLGHTATLLPDGRVLVIGGERVGRDVYADHTSAEIWDPATESFGTAGSLTEGRAYHTATLLPDGRVLVVGGGIDGVGPVTSAEVWEPGDGQPAVDVDSTTSDLLPGVDLVTEEVEPGVYRVLSDGAGHDLVAEPPASVSVAPDGSVWLLRASQDRWHVDALFGLGQDGTPHLFEPSRGDLVDLAVDVNGVAWLSIEPLVGEPGSVPYGTLTSFDGTTWAAPTWPDGSGDIGAIEATSDGAVWVTQSVELGAGPAVAMIEDGAWNVLPTLDDPSLEGHFRSRHEHFVAAPDGSAWLTNGADATYGPDPGPSGLLHFDGERWNVVDLPIEGRNVHAGPLALGPNGTLWVYVRDVEVARHLARLDADGWSIFSESDAVPELVSHYQEARMAVDADGRLWIALGDDWNSEGLPPSLGPFKGPVGVLMFDGTTWHQYLEGLQVNRIDVAEDGTVLATALWGCVADCGDSEDNDWSVGGLYVITPEAVAAAE